MGIAVYPRLDELLRARGLTVAELERRIERQFNMTVDPKTLYRLTHADPIQRADLEIAGAVAKVLDVRLDDLFDVQATPALASGEGNGFDLPPEELDLSPDTSRRMSELFERQSRVGLTPAEQEELNRLVGENGHLLHERRIREIAQLRGVSVEQAREEVARELAQALDWWKTWDADPENRRKLVAEVRRRRRRTPA